MSPSPLRRKSAMDTSIKKKASTIYLHPEIRRALKLKSATMECSISNIVEYAVKNFLIEDIEDINAVRKRKKEPSIDFESFVKKLKKDGKI